MRKGEERWWRRRVRGARKRGEADTREIACMHHLLLIAFTTRCKGSADRLGEGEYGLRLLSVYRLGESGNA